MAWETGDAQHLANLMEAQALATLALVEQQRIANLIAVQMRLSEEGMHDSASEIWNDHIKEGLGL